MKYNVKNVGIDLEVEILDTPQLSFEQVQIATMEEDKSVYVAGRPYWNLLRSGSDMTPLFGKQFDLVSDKWEIKKCYVLWDKKTIYFREAVQV